MRASTPLAFMLLASLLALAADGAGAATVPCGVGARVQGEFDGGEIGTIAEIGTAAPYVGSYRITFGWSPKGEWYHPGTWKVHPEGSSDRCQPPQAISAEAASTPGAQQGSTAAATASPSPRVATSVRNDAVSSDSCHSGAQVVDRAGRRGEVQGEANGMCVVRLADGSSRSYLAWMLNPAGAAEAAPGLAIGRYGCSTQGAGHFEISIVDAATYIDRAGARGRYRLDRERIHFETGSLADDYSLVLGDGKFGLSSEAVQTFYVVCNHQP